MKRELEPRLEKTLEHGDCISCPVEILPLHRATFINNDSMAIQFIDLLISYDADINATNRQGFNPLEYIAHIGSAKIAEQLILKGCELVSAINLAAMYQNNEVLKVLLHNGADPNNTDSKLYLPLVGSIICCGDGFNDARIEDRMETIRILLAHGADPTLGTKSAMQLAHHRKLTDVIQLFGDHGFSLD